MTAPLLLAAISAAILVQIAIGIGVAFWRLQHKEAASLQLRDDDVATTASGAWPGWREFRVERDAFEDQARTQRSLILKPLNGLPLPEFGPGQYLTFSIDRAASLTEPKQTIVRCYSLSDQPNGETYRITVKRMSAPSTRPDLPAGAASIFIHGSVQAGDSESQGACRAIRVGQDIGCAGRIYCWRRRGDTHHQHNLLVARSSADAAAASFLWR